MTSTPTSRVSVRIGTATADAYRAPAKGFFEFEELILAEMGIGNRDVKMILGQCFGAEEDDSAPLREDPERQ